MKTNLIATLVAWFFHAFTRKNLNRSSLFYMNFFQKKELIGLSIFFLVSGQIFAQKDFALNGESGQYHRNGNMITYDWTHTNNMKFSISIEFVRGWSYMKNVYKARNHDHGNYNRFVQSDPFKQDLTGLANLLRRLAKENNVPEIPLALSFVQALPFQANMKGYQRYAVETLIDMEGDCSDTAVLFAGILAAWGYDCIFLNYPGHLAVGVWYVNIDGSYYSHRGRHFYYCETTGWGWEIGKIPDGYYVAKPEDVIF